MQERCGQKVFFDTLRDAKVSSKREQAKEESESEKEILKASERFRVSTANAKERGKVAEEKNEPNEREGRKEEESSSR